MLKSALNPISHIIITVVPQLTLMVQSNSQLLHPFLAPQLLIFLISKIARHPLWHKPCV